jgi:hypothetical protein
MFFSPTHTILKTICTSVRFKDISQWCWLTTPIRLAFTYIAILPGTPLSLISKVHEQYHALSKSKIHYSIKTQRSKIQLGFFVCAANANPAILKQKAAVCINKNHIYVLLSGLCICSQYNRYTKSKYRRLIGCCGMWEYDWFYILFDCLNSFCPSTANRFMLSARWLNLDVNTVDITLS